MRKRPGKTVNYPGIVVVMVDCGAGLVVLTRNEETTDDAFHRRRRSDHCPKTAGCVTELRVRDNQREEGDLVVTIRDTTAQRDQAQARLLALAQLPSGAGAAGALDRVRPA